MRILNEDKLVNKAAGRLEKLNRELNKTHTARCECGAKIEFDGRDVRHYEPDYTDDFVAPSYDYIECPFCHREVFLNKKYSKINKIKNDIYKNQSVVNNHSDDYDY